MEMKMYSRQDGDVIVSWIENEDEYQLWCSNTFGQYPISGDILDRYYYEHNLYPFVFIHNGERIGQICVTFLNPERVRLSYVLVSKSKRNQGFGKEMMIMMMNYLSSLSVKQITLAVYQENKVAYSLYSHLGFESIGMVQKNHKKLIEMRKNCEKAFKIS